MLRAGVTYMQGSMYKVTPKILVILALGGTVCYIYLATGDCSQIGVAEKG